MSTNPPIRYSGPAISPEVPWETRRHLQLLYQKLGNHTQAFQQVANQISGIKAGSTTTSIVEGGGTTPVAPSSGFIGQGLINDQTGATGYATQPSDNGILLILNDASPVSVTLTTDSAPFYLIIANFGAGTATLAPSTGTINGGASLSLLQNQTLYVACDSTNWFSDAIRDAADVNASNTFGPLQKFTAGVQIGSGSALTQLLMFSTALLIESIFSGVAIELGLAILGSTNANLTVEGTLQQASLALATGISGTPYVAIGMLETLPANFLSTSNTVEYQVGAQKSGAPGSIPPPTFAVGDVSTVIKTPAVFKSTVTQPSASVLTAATTATSATAGAATALPSTPAGYLEISINGTVVKLPYYSI